MSSALLAYEFLELPNRSIPNLLFTDVQLQPILRCEELLCKDLSKRYTVTDLAEYANIGVSTLKS